MRKLIAAVVAGSGLTLSVHAQYAAQAPAQEIPLDLLMQVEEFVVPKNEISFGLRLIGRLRADFTSLGTISSGLDYGDLTTEMTRTYNDGAVALDARTDGDGNDLADDGRTNNWRYDDRAQATEDESGIRFHAYDSIAGDARVTAKAGPTLGFDLTGSHEFGRYGAVVGDGLRRVTVGAVFGFGLNTVNARNSGRINATLHTVIDTYSLLGSPVPEDLDDGTEGNGYLAPSSTTQTVTNADGTTSDQVIDNTTYLANLPDSREETYLPGGADIDGTWQVRGAYFVLRSGPWIRWQPRENLSLKLSAGGAFTVIGLNMRYDERLVISDAISPVQDTGESESKSFTTGGLFSGLDAEWWITSRTGLFGSAYYEKFSRDAAMELNGRAAQITTSGGLGLRVGITTKF